MDILVVGGHGQIALKLLELLAAGGHRARGLIRKPEHAPDLEARGAIPVLGDLEKDPSLAPYVEGADAVVFAAGAGPGSGDDRKRTVDLGGALKLIEAAQQTGVSRYVMISSVGAQNPSMGSGPMRAYLEAKGEADEALVKSGLGWTVVRPGPLTDDPPTGLVRVSTELGGRAPVPRADVADVIAAVLDAPNTIGVTFELFSGDVPVQDAVRSLRA